MRSDRINIKMAARTEYITAHMCEVSMETTWILLRNINTDH